MFSPPPYGVAPFPGPPPAQWAPPQTAGVPQSVTWPPRAPAPAAAPAVVQQPEQPRPIVRLQAPEELIPAPAPTRLALPSPEQLGVAAVQPVAHTALPLNMPVDWNVTHDRLDRLGALDLHLTRLSGGTYRVAFVLATTQPGWLHHIEAEAATEGAAVCSALDQADQWTNQQGGRRQ
jgi:hypothetical protein